MISLKKFARSFRRRISPDARHTSEFAAAVAALTEGDVAIDCGANIGIYTAMMAKTGATVHAFEPDPLAFEKLRQRLGTAPNVHLHQAAVSSKSEVTKLYFHQQRADDPVTLSQSSSLLSSKSNVNDSSYVEVSTIRLSDFIRPLGRIKIMKMDVEGHEIEIINDLLDQGLGSNIDHAFVELHDRKNPELVVPTAQLRSRLDKSGLNYNLDWH